MYSSAPDNLTASRIIIRSFDELKNPFKNANQRLEDDSVSTLILLITFKLSTESVFFRMCLLASC